MNKVDPTQEYFNLCQRRLDLWQMTCIVWLVVTVIVLDAVSKSTAHWLVWYMVGLEVIFMINCYIAQRKRDKAWDLFRKAFEKRMEALNARFK